MKNGALDRIRTCDLCLRRAALYPAELRVHLWYGTGSWAGQFIPPSRQNPNGFLLY